MITVARQGVMVPCGKCGGRIATLADDRLHIRIGKMAVMTRMPSSITCGKCGHANHLSLTAEAMRG